MKRFKYMPFGMGLAVCLFALPGYASLPECDVVVNNANQELVAQNKKPVKDVTKLTGLLRTLNKDDVLPREYMTRDEARKLGWSGNPQDSLWNVWALNKKQLGGDRYTGAPLPESGVWYTADIDSVRGISSGRHLIFSAQSMTRYLSTDNDASAVVLPPCQ
ncbi:ribonuclease [Cronobacter turicensis]|nr:ribonuclease [Cronobacter turicensis]EMD9175585.1 ribonuclease [Cronobacter turicensis]MDI6470960.1 ribonuclease [Cronobacter turicensis]